MLRVIGRAMNGNMVEGYVVQETDTMKIFFISKKDLFVQAKNKRVYNVEASRSVDNPVLTGTNGYKLKSLPVIKANTNLDSSDFAACYIRNLVSGKIEPSMSVQESILYMMREEINNGVVTDYNIGIMSSNIEIIDGVYTLKRDGNVKDKKSPLYEGIIPKLVGYIIQNIGDITIPVIRMTATPEHTQSVVMLEKGKKIVLSRAELTLLSSRPEFGFKFSDCKLNVSAREVTNIYDKLNECHLDLSKQEALKKMRITEVMIDTVATQEEIDKYFIVNYKKTISNTLQTSNKNDKGNAQSSTAQNLKSHSSAKDLFNAFKR